MIVEGRIGDQPGHADKTPAGERQQPCIDRLEVRDGRADAERVESIQEFVAGMASGKRGLPFDQHPPHRLILVRIEVRVLGHGPVGRHANVVAAQGLKGGDAHKSNMGAARW